MSWAYSSLAADPVDDPRPPDWPPEWPPPVDPDDPTTPPGGDDPDDPPTWPPGWPIDGFLDHTCTVTAPDEIQEGVAFTIEAEVEDGAGDPESALDDHVMKVSATMNGSTLQIKVSGGNFANQLYYSISNYTGSKYGISESIFADVDVDTDLDEVVTFTCSVISVTPNITGTDTSVVVLEEDLLWAEVATTGNITLSGEQTLDGILTAASKVLVWKQTTAADNGLYTSAAGAWTRDNAFTAADKIYNPIVVARGQGYGQKMFVCTAANTVKLAEKSCNVRVATTANHGLSGTSNVDGQAISAGDIVLVWIQSTASQNGLYTVQSSTWTKIMDFDSDSLHKVVAVTLGTLYGKLSFKVTATNTAAAMGAVYL